MHLSDDLANRIAAHLQKIYKENFSEGVVNRIYEILYGTHSVRFERNSLWSPDDILLITYGDSVLSAGKSPLRALHEFLAEYVGNAVTGIHILPFFPFSSDDGFSVTDFLRVNPDLGDWHDIERFEEDYDLMADLVINHVSKSHPWFVNYLKNEEQGKDYFIAADPQADLSSVIRPRSTPLLTRYESADGFRHVWTTFSEDQADLDFRNPEVLVEMIRIFVFYLQRGIRIIRLDAIAFLWKQAGTSCLHLPETHEVVKLLRTIGTAIHPGFLLLTETNVPNRENLSYFGDGDEAHMVYQFSLPPLLLYTLHSGNAGYLMNWLASLPETGRNCTFFNFTASHDGIGLRPLEGLLPASAVKGMLETMQRYGGILSQKRNPDGSESVYEINITYFDAMKGTSGGMDDLQAERFLCSQLIMLGLKGIPAFYIHSLLATPNDYEGMGRTGRSRSINRRKYTDGEIKTLLKEDSVSRRVYNGLIKAMNIRKKQPAFHPGSRQEILATESSFVAFTRCSEETGDTVYCISNITGQSKEIPASHLPEGEKATTDLIGNQEMVINNGKIRLDPYQTLWLKTLRRF
jgi:sucrose phosphorylase